ncbi:hypothetical protein MAPG_10009 [Magnaporthiopsis poae ATCC 64411]|uniref:Heterokaryon incompatibility domain-containing protein n=1 Tax=Magnaporthiopsis poae (strain ATCC 64411 / 73-15) TaxID=644358 RepID=A0A0C4EBG2_MAGP6|nr:hypothetical protein MAPG_10009 [Magnaporthiopsis poae ATCC 64411]
MRLINIKTLQLEEFTINPPQYAILSHTWGVDEVTFADFSNPSRRARRARQRKSGWAKIAGVCKQALKDKYDYVWVDTCCIDKSSSTELSEAINSMYSWYAHSGICYAYLEDVAYPSLGRRLSAREDQAWYDFGQPFANSRWYRRGWTLQELVAPRSVTFYDKSWVHIANRSEIAGRLSQITGIPSDVLGIRMTARSYPVGHRLSWAAGRRTTRPEDIAYSLMGLLNINMPLLYGEGTKAFLRLQEEVLRQHEDDSLFLWCSARGCDDRLSQLRGLLADSPDDFANFLDNRYYTFRRMERKGQRAVTDIRPSPALNTAVSVDSRGVRFDGHEKRPQVSGPENNGMWLCQMNCRIFGRPVSLYLQPVGPYRYGRARPSDIFIGSEHNSCEPAEIRTEPIILLKNDDAVRRHLLDEEHVYVSNVHEGGSPCTISTFERDGLPVRFQYVSPTSFL